MKRAAAAAFLLGIIVIAISVSPASLAVAQSSEEPLPWTFRGFNYPSWAQEEYLSPDSSGSLGRMAGTGANWVAVVPTWYVDSVNASSIAPEVGDYGRTATDEALVKAIDDAHSQGLGVMLKPHVDVRDGTTRVDIRPASMDLWFADYRAMMLDYARLAEANQVEMLAIGTELAGISGYENNAYWEALIAEVRTVYHGPITYAASMNDYRSVYFWDQLDYLGLDAYFPLSDAEEPTLTELVNGWTDYNGSFGEADWIGRVEAWQASWNKQVIFTELGFRSSDFAARAPWDCAPAGYNGENQARAYESAFLVLRDKPWLDGVFLWDWMVSPEWGGPGDSDFTIRDKPAEAVVTSWFTDGISPTPAIETSLVSVNWASYEDYQRRFLSVTYGFTNTGDSSAYHSAIVASLASGGVSLVTPIPLDLGLIDVGASRQATVVYRANSGITSFHALTYVSVHDDGGNLHYFPDAPPA